MYKEPIIFISPGHYPAKAGVRYGKRIEHFVALEWINVLFDAFDKRYSFEPQFGMGKRPPYRLMPVPAGPLRNKVNYINKHNPAYAVEYHWNGAANRSVYGCETLYCPGSRRGRAMASIIQRRTLPTLNTKDRGVKEGFYFSTAERTNTPLYFLRRTTCPAVIIEPEFLPQYDARSTYMYKMNHANAMIDALDEIIKRQI